MVGHLNLLPSKSRLVGEKQKSCSLLMTCIFLCCVGRFQIIRRASDSNIEVLDSQPVIHCVGGGQWESGYPMITSGVRKRLRKLKNYKKRKTAEK